MKEQEVANTTSDLSNEAWDAWELLIQAFDRLPCDSAKRGFLEYAQAVLSMNKLRRYLTDTNNEYGQAHSPLYGVLFAMKLDDERLWTKCRSGKNELSMALGRSFQSLSCDAERTAFARFADAVIGYHITKNEIAPIDWHHLSM